MIKKILNGKHSEEYAAALLVAGLFCILFNFIENYIMFPFGDRGWMDALLDFDSAWVLAGVFFLSMASIYYALASFEELRKTSK
jgi:hypothetical protein